MKDKEDKKLGKKTVAKKINKLLLGVVIGSAVGSVAGVAFAPKSGKETRKIIKNASIKAIKKASEKTKKPKKGFWFFLNKIFIRKKDV